MLELQGGARRGRGDDAMRKDDVSAAAGRWPDPICEVEPCDRLATQVVELTFRSPLRQLLGPQRHCVCRIHALPTVKIYVELSGQNGFIKTVQLQESAP